VVSPILLGGGRSLLGNVSLRDTRPSGALAPGALAAALTTFDHQSRHGRSKLTRRLHERQERAPGGESQRDSEMEFFIPKRNPVDAHLMGLILCGVGAVSDPSEKT
jgi:hypothetical protein